MLAAVTASNAVRLLAGVSASICASASALFAQRQYAFTLPGPLAPPLTATVGVDANAKSHAVEVDGSTTLATVAGVPRVT